MLRCTKCLQLKQPEEMSKDARRQKGLSSWCKLCRSATARTWGKENPERVKEQGRTSRTRENYQEKSRAYILKHRYGLSIEDYNYLLNLQNNSCAICNVKQEDKTYHFHVDHCHTTGNVRGLLCSPCNVFLGVSKDNIDVFKNAILYLEKEQRKKK